jgi:hypothetical protein
VQDEKTEGKSNADPELVVDQAVDAQDAKAERQRQKEQTDGQVVPAVNHAIGSRVLGF